MKPLLTITGPGPLWSSRRAERGDARWDPDPALFADFAGAVAARYGDRVDRYVIWNEPNLGSWLRPQAACFGKVCTPVSPHLYRGLVRAAYPAIHAADPGAQVLIGAMSSRGDDAAQRELDAAADGVPARARLRRHEASGRSATGAARASSPPRATASRSTRTAC